MILKCFILASFLVVIVKCQANSLKLESCRNVNYQVNHLHQVSQFHNFYDNTVLLKPNILNPTLFFCIII